MTTITTKGGKRYYVVGILPAGDAVDIVYTEDKNNIEASLIEMRVSPDDGVPCGCDDILVRSLDEVESAIMANEILRKKHEL